MRAEVTATIGGYPYVMSPAAWALNLSSLTEARLHFRPGFVINLNPSSYFDISLSLLGLNMDGVC